MKFYLQQKILHILYILVNNLRILIETWDHSRLGHIGRQTLRVFENPQSLNTYLTLHL
jgi:hypothetical protein